jgi:hypothetical protein
MRACKKVRHVRMPEGETYAFVRAIVDVRRAGCGNSLVVVLYSEFGGKSDSRTRT